MCYLPIIVQNANTNSSTNVTNTTAVSATSMVALTMLSQASRLSAGAGLFVSMNFLNLARTMALI